MIALAGCQSFPKMGPSNTPDVGDLDDAFNRLPILVDGIRYQCAKLPLVENPSQRRRAFRDIEKDADAVESLVRHLPYLTSFPDPAGERVRGLTDGTLDAVEELKAAAEARDVQSAALWAERIETKATQLLAYIDQLLPVLSKELRR